MLAAGVALDELARRDEAPVVVPPALRAGEAAFAPAGLAEAVPAGFLVAVVVLVVVVVLDGGQAGWIAQGWASGFRGEGACRERFGPK